MDTVTVRPSSAQRDTLFGFLAVVLVAAIVRGGFGTHRVSTYVVMAIAAALLVPVVVFWIRMRRRPSHLEIGPDLIRFVDPVPRPTEYEVHRADGAIVVGIRMTSARSWVPYLSQQDSGAQFDLTYFKVDQVVEACRTRGWSVTKRVPHRRDR